MQLFLAWASRFFFWLGWDFMRLLILIELHVIHHYIHVSIIYLWNVRNMPGRSQGHIISASVKDPIRPVDMINIP